MKSLVFFLVVLFFGTFLGISQCASYKNASKLTNSENRNDSSPLEIDLTVSPQDREGINEELKEFSVLFNLSNLREKPLSKDQMEFRIWYEISFVAKYCLVLSKINDESKGFLYEIEFDGRSKLKTSSDGKYKIVATDLTSILTSTSVLNSLFNKYQLDKSLPFQADSERTVVDDGTVIYIELKNRGIYMSVFFDEFSQTKNAKSTFEMCEFIENELGISIGCNEQKACKKIDEKFDYANCSGTTESKISDKIPR